MASAWIFFKLTETTSRMACRPYAIRCSRINEQQNLGFPISIPKTDIPNTHTHTQTHTHTHIYIYIYIYKACFDLQCASRFLKRQKEGWVMEWSMSQPNAVPFSLPDFGPRGTEAGCWVLSGWMYGLRYLPGLNPAHTGDLSDLGIPRHLFSRMGVYGTTVEGWNRTGIQTKGEWHLAHCM